MISGDLGLIGSPATHLYVMRKLAKAASGVTHPTFLDAGCGPGYLLMSWVLMAGDGSRAVGIDMNAQAVASAKRHVASPDALDTQATHLPKGATLDAFVGDALKPDAAVLGLSPGSVDAVNVGVAVRDLTALAPLAELLRTGGVMAAPVCKPAAQQPKDVPKGRCEGHFRVFVKAADGTLLRNGNDPEIVVRFVLPMP